MHEHKDLHAWLASRRNVDPPAEFADHVMDRIAAVPSHVSPKHCRLADATWFHVTACIVASVVFVLRLGCVYSLFIATE